MAYIAGGGPKDQGFPDEFGMDMYQETVAALRGQPGSSSDLPAPFWGYVTSGWFGPFLLSPRRRREWGWC